MKDAGLIILGLVAGFFSAALGVGSGTIIMSSLIFFFGYEIKDAVGTSLAAVAPPALIGVIAHYLLNSSNIQFSMALFIILGSVIGARVGAKLEQHLHGQLLILLFAILLLFTSMKLFGWIPLPTTSLVNGSTFYWLVIAGLFMGLCSALFGVGGGIVLVPMLTMFFDLSIHQAVATSLLVILPTVFFGAMFHNKYHAIKTNVVKFMIPTSLIGAVFGAIVSNYLPEHILKVTFGIFLLVAALRMFMQQHTVSVLLKRTLALLHLKS